MSNLELDRGHVRASTDFAWRPGATTVGSLLDWSRRGGERGSERRARQLLEDRAAVVHAEGSLTGRSNRRRMRLREVRRDRVSRRRIAHTAAVGHDVGVGAGLDVEDVAALLYAVGRDVGA